MKRLITIVLLVGSLSALAASEEYQNCQRSAELAKEAAVWRDRGIPIGKTMFHLLDHGMNGNAATKVVNWVYQDFEAIPDEFKERLMGACNLAERRQRARGE